MSQPSTEKVLAAAGMRARGRTIEEVGEVLGVSGRTISNWQRRDDFRAEYDRVRQEAESGVSVHGTLLDALSARKDDGVDWPSRVRAAQELRNKPLPEARAEQNVGPTTISFSIPESTLVADRDQRILELTNEVSSLRTQISELTARLVGR